jgi:hypothetical protein
MTPLELVERRAASLVVEAPAVRAHLKAFGGLTFERCEDPGCTVDVDGHAGCGRLACPACGTSGSVLSSADFSLLRGGEPVGCACGHIWIPLA